MRLRDSELIIHCGDNRRRSRPGSAPNPFHRSARSAATTTRECGPRSLPTHDIVEVGGHAIYVLHDLAELDPRAERRGPFTAVVFGHSPQACDRDAGKDSLRQPPAVPARGDSPCRLRLPRLPCGPVVARAKIVELALSKLSSKRGFSN